LRLHSNQIEILEGLEKVTSIQALELNKNHIKNINHLGALPFSNLRVLNVSYNQISDLDSATVVLVSLKSLEVFDGYENPIEKDARYKYKICENPLINELDGITITLAMKEQYEQMRKENSIDTLIQETSKEYEKRVQTEKLRKEMVLKYMQQHEDNVRQKFQDFRDTMNKELSEFVNYVNYTRRAKERGEQVEITEEFLKQWREKLALYEDSRKKEEEKAKQEIENKYNSLILTKLISTTYSDKLYQIAMTKPEVWKALKRKEYEAQMNEEKNFVNNQIKKKYSMLAEGLEKEQYLNDVINKGQERVLDSMQGDFRVVFFNIKINIKAS